MRKTLALLLAAVLAPTSLAAAPAGQTAADRQLPRYDHVFVIVEENKNYEQIMSPEAAPNIAALAKTYGYASDFWGEVHPSEANYVALLGGDTFGIHDDDAFYCKLGSADRYCYGAKEPGYPDHTVTAPHLGDQLEAAHKSWKGYYETLPEPGSLAVAAGDAKFVPGGEALALYASKHSGFLNFADVQQAPDRAQKIVGFDQFYADLKADRLPSFALVVPNQCNEMHGLGNPAPDDCQGRNVAGLIRRGDAATGWIVKSIQASKVWKSKANVAIVITFDEGTAGSRGGCCGVTPDAPSNYGGGHIPTLVITNHGPRGVVDPTPYNHYSLLRTLEDVFGLPAYLGHAAETDKGVAPMVSLFAVKK
jgi:phosphatidylinositol-3-phosphatase